MWTEQTVETLRKLALEGKSAAWIAVALGAPSRNAVIGKANRIGIKLNGARSPSGEAGFEPPPAAETPWGRRIAAPRSRAPALIRARARADRRIYAMAEVGEMRRIGIAEIREIECRWPIGDPLQEGFAYCGLQVARGHAYCPGHCRLVYRPANS